MVLFVNVETTILVHADNGFGECGLDSVGVAVHADARHCSNEVDFGWGHFDTAIGFTVAQNSGPVGEAKGILVDDIVFCHIVAKFGDDFPARRSLDAVWNLQVLAFLCFQVVWGMRISREPDFSVKFLDEIEDVLNHLLCPFLVRIGEGASNEVNLHIDHNEMSVIHKY